MIASFFDGRVRLRGDALKDPEFMESIKEIVGSREGILEMRTNPRLGSLLVLYDPAMISREDLITAAGILENEVASRPTGKKAECRSSSRLFTRRQESVLLSAVYGLTLLSGFANKSAHIAAAALFTLLAAKHLYDRKSCL